MDEKITQKAANNLVRKRMLELMKTAGFLRDKQRTGFYFRVQDNFIQMITLTFSRSLPQINGYLFPAFLFVNGTLAYLEASMAKFEKELGANASIYFSDIILPESPPSYHVSQFEKVWECNQKLLVKHLIPYLSNLDFKKTLSLFESGRTPYFRTKMGANDNVQCASAIGLLMVGSFDDGYSQLVEAQSAFAQYVNGMAPNAEDTLLFRKNLTYINNLMWLLQERPDQWKDKISTLIAQTISETIQFWNMRSC